MNETQIADYLLAHPEFFERHAELLAAIQLKSPHGAGVISLQERQMALLRTKNKQLEQRIATLLRYGQENDAMANQLIQLTARLLAQREPDRAPHRLLTGLSEIFELSHTALRLWDMVENASLAGLSSNVHPKLRQYADQLLAPACGKADDIEAIQWLKEKDGDGWVKSGNEAAGELRSAALIALRHCTCETHAGAGKTPRAFGLILIGSSDPARFDAEMATDFLARIGVLSSAALADLFQTVVPNASLSVERAPPRWSVQRPLPYYCTVCVGAPCQRGGAERLEHFSVDFPKEQARRQYAQYGEREATQGKSLKNVLVCQTRAKPKRYSPATSTA